MADDAADHNIPELFAVVENELATKKSHLENLATLLTRLDSAKDLFDKNNLLQVHAVFQQRSAEYEAVHSALNQARQLYDQTVRTLEDKIHKKAALIAELDAELGIISAEDRLCQHFAEEQALLAQGLRQVKDILVQQICKTLGPSLQGNPGPPVTSSVARHRSRRRH